VPLAYQIIEYFNRISTKRSLTSGHLGNKSFAPGKGKVEEIEGLYTKHRRLRI
jgi:hypothetical protein